METIRTVLLNTVFLFPMKPIKFMTMFTSSYPIRYVKTAYIIVMNQEMYLNLKNKPGEYVPHMVHLQDQRLIDLTQDIFICPCKGIFFLLI